MELLLLIKTWITAIRALQNQISVWFLEQIAVGRRFFFRYEGSEAEPATPDLIMSFQQGHPEAFELIYQRFKNYVYRVACFLVRDDVEAEDAVQETFLDVLHGLPHYVPSEKAAFETWLYRVTINRCTTRLRRKVLPSTDWDEMTEQMENLPTPDLEGDPEAVCLGHEETLTLWRAVDTLSEEHRAVLVLRYGQDLGYEEIAQVLNINSGTVKSRLFNAHRKLRSVLEAMSG